MSAENRKLDDLRQYVSSIYRIMQSQIETKLDAEGNPLPDNVNDTLQEINTKLAFLLVEEKVSITGLASPGSTTMAWSPSIRVHI